MKTSEFLENLIRRIYYEIADLVWRLHESLLRFIVRVSGSVILGKRLKRREAEHDRFVGKRKDFAEVLARKDSGNPVKRIFVMGCGRSGTWLLYSMLSAVRNAYQVFEEVDVGHFARIESKRAIHILKRHKGSFSNSHLIPDSIGIVWIIRHPFDVVTSHNPNTADYNPFHIAPNRWNAEMDALNVFLSRPRANGLLVRYEDLVQDPEKILARIRDTFAVEVRHNPSEFVNNPQVPSHVRNVMHGLRPVSVDSIARWRSDPTLVDRVRDVIPKMSKHLSWVAQRFGYDITPP